MEQRSCGWKYGINCALEEMAPGAPVVFSGDIGQTARAAAEIGYDALELFIQNPAQYNSEKLKSAAKNSGIAYCGIATGMEYTQGGLSLISDDAMVRRAAVRRLREHIDLARELDCLVIIGIMRGNIPDFGRYALYEGYLREALEELSAYAAAQGVQLALEAIMRYINNYLNSVPETLQFLDRLALPNLRIHIDSHLMNVEDRDIRAGVLACRDRLAYVHYSDSNRAYPGGGRFDFKEMTRALLDIDYKGYVTVECQPLPTPEACAKRGLAYMRALETIVSVERLPIEKAPV